MRNKWPVDEMRPDLVDKLKDHSRVAFGESMQAKMFSADFKQHCDVITNFKRLLETNSEELTQVIDLIFKWTSVKFAEANKPIMIISIFDFLAILIEYYSENSFMLEDFEAAVLIPMLVEKTGH